MNKNSKWLVAAGIFTISMIIPTYTPTEVAQIESPSEKEDISVTKALRNSSTEPEENTNYENLTENNTHYTPSLEVDNIYNSYSDDEDYSDSYEDGDSYPDDEGYSDGNEGDDSYPDDESMTVTSFSSISELQSTWTPSYLEDYCIINGIDTDNFFEERDYILDKYAPYSDEYIEVKQDSKWGTEYFVQTHEDSTLFYSGELKNGKPHGVGMLYELFWNNYVYNYDVLRVKYIGEFEDGTISGFGMMFDDDELRDDETFVLEDIEEPEIAQQVFNNYFSPLVSIGEFDKGVLNGNGATFEYPDTYNLVQAVRYGTDYNELPNMADDIAIFTGDFKNNKLNGNGKIYYNGWLLYEGETKDFAADGFGKLYYPNSSALKYEGDFKNSTFHGNGTEYSEDGEELYSGGWKNGDYDY